MNGRLNLNGKVELLLHTAGTGFAQYYTSLKFSRITANIDVNKKASIR